MAKTSYSQIKSYNARLASQTSKATGVFTGGTSGIGYGVLTAFIKHIPEPHAVIVGRNKSSFAPKLKELEKLNPRAKIEFLEANLRLLKTIEDVSRQIGEMVKTIDYLFMSQGYLNFGAREENEEGLDASQSLRYYTRLRLAKNLLPKISQNGRIISILAGGQEGPLLTNDLELKEPQNYGLIRAATQSATMTTLSFEKLARENPSVGFIHVYPGVVQTDLLIKSTSGILGFLFRWVITPLMSLFSISVERSGESIFCYATASEFAGPGAESKGGCWILDEHGEVARNEKVMQPIREDDGERRVWEHTLEEWKRVLG